MVEQGIELSAILQQIKVLDAKLVALRGYL